MFRNHTEVFRTPVSSTATNDCHCTNGTNAYKCDFCVIEWQSESEVFIHKQEHYDQEKLKEMKDSHSFCWTCVRKFESQPDLIEHFKEHHLLSSPDAKQVQREIFVCNICSAILFNKKMLEVHLVNYHRKSKVKREIECLICDKKIAVKGIWCHFAHHDMIGLHVCPICHRKFPHWDNLKDHLKEHPYYLYCNVCGKEYNTVSAYDEHCKEHIIVPHDEPKSDEDELDENVYDRYFIHSKNTQLRKKLTPHMGLILQKELTICVLCREICTTYNEQRRHILNHQFCIGKIKAENGTDPVKLEIVCSCGEVYYNRVLFKQHLLRNKDDEVLHFSV